MPSGGARSRSGPAPDPNALRRGRATDAEWTTLPVEGFKGRIPTFPLAEPISLKALAKASGEDDGAERSLIAQHAGDRLKSEKDLWKVLWRKPQAVMWDRLGMKYQVAAYVRAYLEAASGDATSGLKVAVLRMEGELGLSVPGLNALRWKIARNEVAEQRDVAEVATEQTGAQTARERLRAIRAS